VAQIETHNQMLPAVPFSLSVVMCSRDPTVCASLMHHGSQTVSRTFGTGREGPSMRAGVLLNVVFLLVVCLASFLPAASVEHKDAIRFPYLLTIAPGNVLVVHGHVFRDSVLITREPGDSLRVEGLPIYPLPPVPRKVISEHGLAKIYGRVDYVRELVDSGYTWWQATEKYFRKMGETVRSAQAVYKTVIDSTGSHEKAAQAAVDSFDRSLVEPGTEPVVTRTSVIVSWQGSVTEHIMSRRRRSDDRPVLEEIFGKSTEEDIVRLKVRELATWLDGRRRGTYFVLKSPRGTSIYGGKTALKAIAQIEEAKRGNITDGPVDEREIRRVIGVQDGVQE
jgi:hypothetical protein